MAALWTFSYDKINTPVHRGRGKWAMETSYRCNSDRLNVPPELSGAGVSAKSWAKIVDICNSELVPAMKASDEWDYLLAPEMWNYTPFQMFGQESSHEKKLLHMIHKSAILNNNLSLMTYKAVTLANALLNKHNVLVQPSFAVTAKALKTNGLIFVLIDE